MGKRKAKLDPDDREYSEILKKHKKKIRKTHGTSHAMQRMVHLRITKVMQSNDKAKDFKTMYGCTVEFSSIHKATSGMFSTHKTWRSHCRKWIFSLTHYHLVRKLPHPRCHKRWRFRMQKLQWKRNGRRSKRFLLGSWTKSSAKSMLFWKHKETKQVFFATLIKMCRFKKCGVRTKNFRSSKADSCSAWTL